MKFSEIIRGYRKERSWTLANLSKITALSIAQLSKLERGKSSPSLDSLRKLAAAYEVPMSALTHVDDVTPLHPIRGGDGFILKAGPEENVLVRYLTISRSARMQPVIMTIPAGADTGLSKSHPSDEFFYVIQGQVIFYYDKESFRMNKGDFLYFDGYVLHHWKNVGDEEAIVFSCNDPPVI